MVEKKKSRRERAQAGEIKARTEYRPGEIAELDAIDWDAVDRSVAEHRAAGYPSLGHPDDYTNED